MDTQTLERELDRFDGAASLAEASTPPASWYLDPRLFALEREAVLLRHWQYACPLEQVAQPGQFFSGDAGGMPWVVLRHPDGDLRAFHNACRHHAAEVARGSGIAERLTCPYHGWTYELDGRLRSAPALGGVRGFEREHFGLRPLAVAAIGPLVLVCAAERPLALESDLSALWARLAATGWQELRFARRQTWELACNWKVFVDNYLDGGYHVSGVHPALAGGLDLSSYASELLERASIQSSAGRRGDPDPRVGASVIYAWFHPGVMINRYGPVLDVNHVVPLAPDRCRVVMDFWFEQGASPEFVAESLAQSERVQCEDAGICESVQRGLASPAYDRGRYSVLHEGPMHHFHRLLAADLRARLVASGRSPAAPPPPS